MPSYEFQINNRIYLVYYVQLHQTVMCLLYAQYCMRTWLYWKLFCVYFKFKFNWTSFMLFGNPGSRSCTGLCPILWNLSFSPREWNFLWFGAIILKKTLLCNSTSFGIQPVSIHIHFWPEMKLERSLKFFKPRLPHMCYGKSYDYQDFCKK